MVCTTARDAVLRESDSVWYETLLKEHQLHFQRFAYSIGGPAVVRDIPMMPYENFKAVEGGLLDTSRPQLLWGIKRQKWPTMRGPDGAKPLDETEKAALAKHAMHVARLRFATRCQLCKSKNKHIPVWGLGCRVCSTCFKENLVSGAVLYKEYGVDYVKRARELAGRVYFFQRAYTVKFMAKFLTNNPIDFQAPHSGYNVFFWRPHLQEVMDLDALKREHRDPRRRLAAQRLTASVRAHHIRVAIAQKCSSTRSASPIFYIMAEAKAEFSPVKSNVKSNGRPHSYTVRPLTTAQRILVAEHHPHYSSRRAYLDHEVKARRLLQLSFLGYRGDYCLPAARNPALVLERLKTLEAVRCEMVIKDWGPNYVAAPAAFKRWQDLVPSLRSAR